MWCDDDVPMVEPYSMIGTATTLPKDEGYVPQDPRPIGFIWVNAENQLVKA